MNSQKRAVSLRCALITALLGLCGQPYARAQQTTAAPVAAEPAAVAGTPDALAAAPAAPTDVAAEVAALRAELGELKSRQEEAEAAKLLESRVDESATAMEPETLRIYGFMDFGLDKFFYGKNEGGAVLRPTLANTFVFGNLNLYFDANPVEHLRCLAEVRLTLAPHGEETQLGPPVGTSYERIDTTAFDFSSPSSQSTLRLGGLYIERAWSEYELSKAFKLQWGLFLNPFGIWNLDHGSPTLISLMLPSFISSQMVPTRLLGLHAYGSVFLGSSEIGYALHVTNGRTPIDFDFTEDKAVGARLYWATEADFGRLVLGASGYVGSYHDQQRRFVVESASQKSIQLKDTVHYNEEVVGLDAALDVGSLRVRAEGVFRWVKYHDGEVEQALGPFGEPVYLPNRLEFSGYVLAAYRTPFRVEPYLEAESMINKSAVLPRWTNATWSVSNVATMVLSVGINVELTTHTQLKTQLAWNRAYDRNFENKNTDAPIFFVRLVDSF